MFIQPMEDILKTISAKMSSQRLDMTFDFSHECFCSEKVNYHSITGTFILIQINTELKYKEDYDIFVLKYFFPNQRVGRV